ncbi:hypothetical protein [Pseudoalteromonas sp.]|uniref:hypothetical protein n=1 Tax=Pseudoalteromonas sp. TaxID=53249 RepID=UPI00260EE351|nr:hypothetical protein [Pseudoalteromonas sp.]MCP4585328.1 hypothetical protein [Pseudoalteromonas sp.]
MWTRGRFNKEIVPGYFALMIDSYRNKRHSAMGKDLMTTKSSSKAREQNIERSGLGSPVVKGEGEGVTYDTQIAGAEQSWYPLVRALAVRITEEAIDDNLYELNGGGDGLKEIFHDLSEALAENEEVEDARFLQEGDTTTYHTCRDTLALFSASHTRLDASTYSNTSTAYSDLTYTSFWASVVACENQLNHRQHRVGKKVKNIWIPPELERNAIEILKSTDRPDTANRAINAMVSSGRKISIKAWPHLTDTDAWFLQLDGDGIIKFNRRKTRFAKERDFQTGDMMVKGDQRFSAEINDPRCFYGVIPAD